MLNMQNAKELEIPEGRVRTIHDKDNRLIWGRLAYNTKYAGDTYQQSYSGKNLFNVNGDFDYGNTNHKTTSNGDGTLTSTAAFSASRSSGQRIEGLVANTTYTLTVTIDSYTGAGKPNAGIIQVLNSSGSLSVIKTINFAVASGIPNTISETFTTPADVSAIWVSFSGDTTSGSGVAASATFSGIQLEAGSATSFEPYTGGIPAPNPDYPQPIQVVTGEQTVTISDGVNSQDYTVNLTSKNLFSSVIEIGGINAGGQAMNMATRLNSKDFINVQPNTTYTFSAIPKVAGKTINIYFNGYKEDGTLIANLPANAWHTSPVTFTTPANCSKIKMSGRYSDDSSFGTVGTVTDAFQNVQLEEGNEATTYAPYYNYELCKIDTYQDYIYKNGADWYVHKECTHYAFTGDEDWQLRNTQAGGISTFSSNFSGYKFEQGACNNALCNYYTNLGIASSVTPMYTKGIGFSLYYYTGYIGRALYINTMDANLPTFKTNISGKLLYYALATPTDTQITDATLVGQLDAIHEWLTRYGYSATVTGNLPIIINQTNL